MRHLVLAVTLLAACSKPPSSAAPPSTHEPGDTRPAGPVSDLHFNDEQLDAIATNLIGEAQLRGVETSAGRNRVERLLSLEASLGGGAEHALTRVNNLVGDMTATDVSQWGELRQCAEREFCNRNDDTARRVCGLLARWQRRKADTVFRYLSSNYDSPYITSLEWERRFRDFITERPVDAATWAWLVLGEHGFEARQQYGRANSETAYRFYVVFSGLSDGREAERIFSVPGVEIRRPPGKLHSSARSQRVPRVPRER